MAIHFIPSEIPLKKDGDRPLRNRKKQQEQGGHHVTRVRENFLLVDFLSRRTEGALLLSGKRGVGKTSAIFAAINNSMQKLDPKSRETEIDRRIRLIPVVVNAPSFDIRGARLTESDVENSPSNNEKLPQPSNQSSQETVPYNLDLLDFKRVVLQNIVRRLYKVVDEMKDNKEIQIRPRNI